MREAEDQGQDDGDRSQEPTLTYILIGINVVVALGAVLSGANATGGGRGGDVIRDGARLAAPVATASSGASSRRASCTPASPPAFNMFALYVLGTMLEPAIGRLRFGVIYFVSLLAGSFGALLLQPTAPTVGASGAIFGLMGAAVVVMRNRGINPMESGLGLWIGLNLLITFTIPDISIGGHIGGLLGGALARSC